MKRLIIALLLATCALAQMPDNPTGPAIPAGLPPTGAASGALAGTYPAPTLAYSAVNAQTGTTYALLTGDRDKLITLTNGSAIAVSIAQAGSTGFPDGWETTVLNSGVGTATITPAVSTIEGAATLTLTTGQSARIVSNGTNYRAIRVGDAVTGASTLTTPGAVAVVGETPGTVAEGAMNCTGANCTIGTTVLGTSGIVGLSYPSVTIAQYGTPNTTNVMYSIVGTDSVGRVRVVSATTTTSPNTADGTNYNRVTVGAWSAVAPYVAPVGACSVYRTMGYATQGLIGTIASCASGGFLNDTGLVGDSAPTPTDSSGSLNAALKTGEVSVDPNTGITHTAPAGDDGETIIDSILFDPLGASPMPWKLISYRTSGGPYFSGATMYISNKRQDIFGRILGIKDSAANVGCCMLGISPDIDGTALGLEGHGLMGTGYTNQLILAGHDLDDVWGGATGYSVGYGKKKFGLSSKGKMFWGTNLGSTPLTSYDHTLEENSDGLLFVAKNDAPQLQVKDHLGAWQLNIGYGADGVGGFSHPAGAYYMYGSTGIAFGQVFGASPHMYLSGSGISGLSPGGNVPAWKKYSVVKIAANGTLVSGTYTSGITATGTVGQTCVIDTFNGGGASAAVTVALTGTDTIAGGTALVVTNAGTGYGPAITSGTAGNGTATCSGTAVVATTLTGSCQTAKGCWSVNSAAVAEPAAAATSQAVPWLAAPANAELEKVRIKTTTACAGLTAITISDLGTTASASEFYTGGTFNLKTAVSNTQLLWPTLITPGLTAAATNWTVTIAAGAENVDDITNGCSFDIQAKWAVMP